MLHFLATIFLLIPLMFGDVYPAPVQEQVTLVDAQVVYVDDADTLKVKLASGFSAQVRLACVDAPEVPHTQIAKTSTNSALVNHFKWGKSAVDFVKSLIPIKSNIKIHPTSIDYRYGRTVGQVFLPDGRNLAELLVGAGLAQNYDEYINQCSDKDLLIAAQAKAKSNLIGIWSDPSYIPPSLARKLALIRSTTSTTPTTTPTTTIPIVPSPTSASASESPEVSILPECVKTDCNCSNFQTQSEAQSVFDSYPTDKFDLDRNHNGIACEGLKT